jgi:nitroreductase
MGKLLTATALSMMVCLLPGTATSGEKPKGARSVLKAIKSHRKVRRFKSTPIPDKHLRQILDTARYAPTVGDQQPWRFLVVRSRARLVKLKDSALDWHMDKYRFNDQLSREEFDSIKRSIATILDNLLSAPVYVAVLVDSKAKYPDYVLRDGILAAGNMMIAARALGYGTGFFTTFFPDDKMRVFFDIPDRYELVCFTPIGIPEGSPKPLPRKKLDDIIVYEAFKNK